MDLLVNLDESMDQEAGRKGAILKTLNLYGFSVPRTFVIRDSFQRELLGINGIKSLRDINSNLSLPKELEKEIDQKLLNRPGVKYVVRSSCSVEDLPFANAAGQYTTFLGLDSVSNILKAIQQTYYSLSNPSVWDYLAYHGIDGENQTMSILIQEMVVPQWAGVMYTQSPLDTSQIVIEYLKGLGTSVVSGIDLPRRIWINRVDGKIGNKIQPPFDVSKFYDTAMKLEQIFGKAQDIEWGWTDKLILFQSRDIICNKVFLQRTKMPLHIPKNKKLRINPFSQGLSIGKLVERVSEKNLGITQIALVKPKDNREQLISSMETLGGVVCTSGGILSHFAATCREKRLPGCSISSRAIENFRQKVIVLDCENAVIYPLSDLDNKYRQQIVFDWAWNLSERSCLHVHRLSKTEAVIINPIKVIELLLQLERIFGAREQFVQIIKPFDFLEKEYTGVIVRLQSEPGLCRLQFKKPIPSTEFSRTDQEVHLFLSDENKGEQLLRDLGYHPRGKHERAILRYEFDNYRIQFFYWPKATAVYAGIEATDQEALTSLLNFLQISTEESTSLEGIQLFKLFNIDMENCLFSSENIPSVRDMVLEKG